MQMQTNKLTNQDLITLDKLRMIHLNLQNTIINFNNTNLLMDFQVLAWDLGVKVGTLDTNADNLKIINNTEINNKLVLRGLQSE